MRMRACVCMCVCVCVCTSWLVTNTFPCHCCLAIAMVIQAAFPCLCPLDSEREAQDSKREVGACMHTCVCMSCCVYAKVCTRSSVSLPRIIHAYDVCVVYTVYQFVLCV